MSLFVFVFLARHAWPANADDAYERVVGEYAQNLEHYYENRSDAWSFHGDAGTKCSQNEGEEENHRLDKMKSAVFPEKCPVRST